MHTYLSIDPEAQQVVQMHGYLLAAVAPRPIALASTLDADGNPNLAPFSYFNVFSTRPPVLIIGPNRSGKTGRNKDTFHNAMATGEVVINMVNYAMVEQINLASCEYEAGINEFVKSGLSPLASELVKPARVAESPIQMECKVREIIVLGTTGGAGNLIICQVVKMHIRTDVLMDESQRIDPLKLDQVARMGGEWYCRATAESMFEIRKPVSNRCIGFDGLPENIRNSSVLTGNELAKLANIEVLPDDGAVSAWQASRLSPLSAALASREDYHLAAKELLAQQKIEDAWMLLLSAP